MRLRHKFVKLRLYMHCIQIKKLCQWMRGDFPLLGLEYQFQKFIKNDGIIRTFAHCTSKLIILSLTLLFTRVSLGTYKSIKEKNMSPHLLSHGYSPNKTIILNMHFCIIKTKQLLWVA